MTKKFQKPFLSLCCFFLFLSINLIAQQTVVTFDSYSSTPINCNDQWEENGVLMYTDDNQGSCFFGADPGLFWLYPSCIVIEVGSIPDITSIEVVYGDNCGPGCTSASVYNGSTLLETQSNSQVGPTQSFIFDNPGMTSVRICSGEGAVEEVRINHGQAECSISNVISEAHACDANGMFLVDVAFTTNNPTSANFSILGNGNNYGTFPYGQTFYTVGPLVGDGSTYEFVIQDTENPNCNDFTVLQAPVCSTPECSITNLVLDPGVCDGDTYALFVNFNYENVTGATFDLYFNGNFFGFYEYSQLPLTINVPVSTSSVDWVSVNDNDNPNCTTANEYNAPICSPPCDISDVLLIPGECNGETYDLFVNFNYENVTGATFDLHFNGNFFGNYEYSQLPLNIIVPAFTSTVDWVIIYDNDNPDCNATNAYNSPLCTEPCSNPTMNAEEYINGTTVLISWPAVTGAIKYKIRYKEDGGSWTEVTTTNLEYTLSGLNPNSVYIYQIKVQCPDETYTTWSASYFIQTWADCPIPTGIEVQVISGNVVKICWTPVAQANNNYKIRYRKASDNTWSEYNLTGTCANLSGLMPETGYVFQIKSKCDGLSSTWSSLADFVTGATLCDRPELLYVEPINNTDVILGWTAQAGASKYKYRYRPVGGTWSSAITTTNTYSATLSLEPGTVYECQFKSKCGDSWTIWSPKYNFNALMFRDQVRSDANQFFTVFPNPARDVLHLSASNIEQCWITSINGNRVLELTTFDNLNEINIQELKAGLYYISIITADQKVQTKAFVKK